MEAYVQLRGSYTAIVTPFVGDATALVVTPYYNKPGQEGLFRHYEAVARQGGLAVLAYNIPGRTACDMTAETVAKLYKAGHLAGIKEASGNIARAAEIMKKVDDRF